MNDQHHISRGEILIVLLCVANACWLVIAAFHRGNRPTELFDSREKLSFVALFLAFSSQIFYLSMLPFGLGWLFLDRDSIFHDLHVGFFVVGFWLSLTAFCAACFGRGIRRLVSIWVAVTTGFLWSLVSLAFLFSKP